MTKEEKVSKEGWAGGQLVEGPDVWEGEEESCEEEESVEGGAGEEGEERQGGGVGEHLHQSKQAGLAVADEEKEDDKEAGEDTNLGEKRWTSQSCVGLSH